MEVKTLQLIVDYRALLLEKRAELISASHPLALHLTGPEPVSFDGQAPINHDRFISSQVKTLDYRTLQQIDAALDRIATGEFGICTACGEDISPKRLAVIPWARCCAACQE
jgi:DnaK suppressor protein